MKHGSAKRGIDPSAHGARSHVRTGIVLSIIQVFGLLLSVGQDVISAKLFGARVEMDVYLEAWIVPVVLANIVGPALQNALVPHFALARTQHGDEAALEARQRGLAGRSGGLRRCSGRRTSGISMDPRLRRRGRASRSATATATDLCHRLFCLVVSRSLDRCSAGYAARCGRFVAPRLARELDDAQPDHRATALRPIAGHSRPAPQPTGWDSVADARSSLADVALGSAIREASPRDPATPWRSAASDAVSGGAGNDPPLV